MTTPFLGGLGAALQSLGQTSTQNAYLKQLQDEQAKRDALQQLATMNTIGARPLQPGENPDEAIQNIVAGNTIAQQKAGAGAVPNTALGGMQKPYMDFGNPYTTSIGNQQILVNPGQSTAALADKRALAAQASAEERETSRENAAADRQQAQIKAAADAALAKAQKDAEGYYNALPTDHPLRQKPFNADWSAAYLEALKEVGTQANTRLTASLRPPPAQFTFTQGLDANGKPVIVSGNKQTGAVTPTEVGAVPKVGAGGAGQGAQTSLPDMLRTSRAMEANENDPNFRPSTTDEAQEAMEYAKKRSMAGVGTPMSGAIATGVSGLINSVHPSNDASMTYLQNARSFGEDAAQSFKGRTNEERVLRDVANGRLSAATLRSPQLTQSIQQRRHNVIAMAAMANPAQFQALSPQDQAVIAQYIKEGGGSIPMAAPQAAPSAGSKDPEFDALMSQLKKP